MAADQHDRGRRPQPALLFLLALAALIGSPRPATAFGPKTIAFAQLRSLYARPDSRFLEVGDGVTVHVRDVGPRSAPVLVLVHGFGASAADWDPWITRLSGSRRVIALDLPGHGLTETPEGYRASITGFVGVLDAVALRLGLSRFALAGNSMGGEVAWRYAQTHPDRLTALILVDAAGWPAPPRPGGALLFTLMRLPPARLILKLIDERPLARQGLKAAFVDEALVTPDLVDRYVFFARAPGHKDILLRIDRGPLDDATPDALKEIRVPTLVMVGAKDRLIPPGDGKKFADAVPGARLVVFPEAGHVPMEQAPDASAAALADFLAPIEAAAARPQSP